MLVEAINRYWSKVAKGSEDECWPWTGARTPAGYGQIGNGSTKHNRPRRSLATHVALAIDGKPRPSAAHVAMHTCDNPRCVNPRHLKWGTATENMQDMWRKGRSGTQKRIAAEMDLAAMSLAKPRRGATKLSEDLVRYIRTTDKSTADLARELEVTWACIDNVRKNRVWRDVEILPTSLPTSST